MPNKNRQLSLSLPLVLVLAVGALATTPETVLYSFPGSGSGSNPYASLIADSSGNLYGTTGEGGYSNHCSLGSGCGTVFMLASSSRAETVLYSFQGTSVGDGSSPQSSLILDKTGALYGTTASGGVSGKGTVFKLTPPAAAGDPWTETVLHSFAGGSDGSNPASALIFDGTSLYGTTPLGGASDFGTVFKLAPPAKSGGAWTETILYSFTGLSDGGKPYSGLVLVSGSFYGTTLDGGPSSQGTVFKLTPPAVAGRAWTESVIYGFTGGKDGGKPYANVTFRDGLLYGTTGLGGSSGYGTVFKLTPPATGVLWTESVLHSFAGGSSGSYPRYGVVADSTGNLYGTTGVGTGNAGIVFELVAPAKPTGTWTETVLWTFTGESDGGDTTAGLLLDGGVLYGTTSLGGKYSDGTVFSVTP
jgi:uncharacterized repeat protein (TIGR03803 family)